MHALFLPLNASRLDNVGRFVRRVVTNLDVELVFGPIDVACGVDGLFNDGRFIVGTNLNGNNGLYVETAAFNGFCRETPGGNESSEQVEELGQGVQVDKDKRHKQGDRQYPFSWRETFAEESVVFGGFNVGHRCEEGKALVVDQVSRSKIPARRIYAKSCEMVWSFGLVVMSLTKQLSHLRKPSWERFLSWWQDWRQLFRS